ncbi:sodium-independent sulfate anion transporter-like isoform X2 [Bacillus rossius redtenbacheri]|uniref:sodium-independent sulfate anion transporter-like isoform X2 n=1 Tax=Bacillus rossius redtenbacheri TaxID=93214 RepID=UPI002FDDFC9E
MAERAVDTTAAEERGATRSPLRAGCSEAAAWLRRRAKGACSKEAVYRKLPAARWLPRYRPSYLPHDLLAGFTVGLTAIPQGIAYAIVAGLGPQYGLYSCFMSSFMYILVGSCKDVTVGPTAILGLLTQPYVLQPYMPPMADFAVLLAFLNGSIIFLLGVLHLGFLVDFISIPTTAGFTAAAAITIASSQLKSLLGIPGRADNFLNTWISFFSNITQVRLWDSVLGISTIIALLVLRKLKDFAAGRNNPQVPVGKRVLRYALWLTSLARNALAIIVGTVLAYTLSDEHGENSPFVLTGEINQGLPPFAPPPFSTSGNGTEFSFGDMVGVYGTALGVVPLVSILGHIAIAKAFTKGRPIDATQELIALGLCNMSGSFVRSMPVTGSFTRTAVNNASGVRTTLGGMFTGILILLTLTFLTSTFAYIPRASLAGLIVCAMIFMVEVEIIPMIWRTKKVDLLPLAGTFLFCLFLSLEYGIIIGVAINLFFILHKSARPSVSIQRLSACQREVLLARPDSGLFFPAAENIREAVLRACAKTPGDCRLVVVDGSFVHSTDSTVTKNLKLLSEDLKANGRTPVYWNWKPDVERSCVRLDDKMADVFSRATSVEAVVKDLGLDKGAEDSGEAPAANGSHPA